jgi:hypothetical protein
MVAWIKQLFCAHRWDKGNRINKLSRLGFTEYTCKDCGKVIYVDYLPISWQALEKDDS